MKKAKVLFEQEYTRIQARRKLLAVCETRLQKAIYSCFDSSPETEWITEQSGSCRILFAWLRKIFSGLDDISFQFVLDKNLLYVSFEQNGYLYEICHSGAARIGLWPVCYKSNRKPLSQNSSILTDIHLHDMNIFCNRFGKKNCFQHYEIMVARISTALHVATT